MFNFKRIIAYIALVSVFLSFAACAKTDNYEVRSFFAMDTVIEISVSAKKNVSELLSECEAIVYEVENEVSKTKTESDIYKLNNKGNVSAGKHTRAILEAALLVADLTNGAYDPTVARLTELWQSLDGDYELPPDETFTELMSSVGYQKINIDGETVSLLNGAAIDLGGIAKGYTAELIVDHIEANAEKFGVKGGMISFGGAVSVFGEKSSGEPYKIAVRDPDDADGQVGVVNMKKGHISVSGDYERYVTVGGKKYHHIIDPKTGFPADTGLRSVAVISDDGALADALSTALFVMGYDEAMELYRRGEVKFEAIFTFSDGSTKTTDGVDFNENGR